MLHVLLEQAGSAHCRNEQTTVAQPAARPSEENPSVIDIIIDGFQVHLAHGWSNTNS